MRYGARMQLAAEFRPCPCGSGLLLASCCGPYLDGDSLPPTAEALMRSRYCAFALRNASYLLATWDAAGRPPMLDLTDDQTEWLGLQILSTEAGGAGDVRGRVEFVARFRHAGTEHTLHEHSRFRKQGKQWLYIDGEIKQQRAALVPVVRRDTVGRNDPCPCGSGSKWKRCCGK